MPANLAIEPQNEVITVLRARLTDYNSASRAPSGINWIYPEFPNIDMQKNSYPMIAVTEITETAEIIDVARNMKYTSRLQIDIFVWDGIDGQDQMLLTVSGTVYSGKKLLDLIAADIKLALDDNKSDFNDDTNLLHNYRLLAKVDMGKDPDRPQVIRKRIEVEYDYYR